MHLPRYKPHVVDAKDDSRTLTTEWAEMGLERSRNGRAWEEGQGRRLFY